MKTFPHPLPRAVFIGLVVGLSPQALAAEAASTPAVAPKTHVLFMGADIALKTGKEYERIEDVTASALVVRPGGQRREVPLAQGRDLLINDTLKLAATNVAIGDLKAERTYTPGTDPFQYLVNSVTLASGQSAVADLQQGAQLRAQMGVLGANIVLQAVKGTPNEGMGQTAVHESEMNLAAAESALTQTYNTPGSEVYDVGAQSAEAGTRESKQLFDAIRLSFDVTPERDLALPYYAFIAQIRERDSKPGQVRKWAFVKSLGPIRAGETRSVSVFQAGLPPGYSIEGTEVHVYDRGVEVATNLSRKRVPLTDDEALEFEIIEYVGANKGRTLPAALLTKTFPVGLRRTLTPARLRGECYVRVARDGRVLASSRDAAGKDSLADPELAAALATLRFQPALEAGKPVEAIVPVDLGHLGSP